MGRQMFVTTENLRVFLLIILSSDLTATRNVSGPIVVSKNSQPMNSQVEGRMFQQYLPLHSLHSLHPHHLNNQLSHETKKRKRVFPGKFLLSVRKRNSELLNVLNSLPSAMKKMMKNGK